MSLQIQTIQMIPIIPILTRYLYEKQDVENALLVSLLDGEKEAALFWAYELYYSGFQKYMVVLLWNIYYDFYAVAHPFLEKYLKENLSLLPANPEIVGIVIRNFSHHRPTLDVFILRKIMELPTFTLTETTQNQNSHLNLLSIAYYIWEYKEPTMNKLYQYCEDTMGIKMCQIRDQMDKLPQFDLVSYKKVFLAIIMVYFMNNIQERNKKGNEKGNEKEKRKKKLVLTKFNELDKYKTITLVSVSESKLEEERETSPQRELLKIARKYGINDNPNISLFRKQIEEKMVDKASIQANWLYWASFSRVWNYRIRQYGGKTNNIKQLVLFEDEENEDVFYYFYGYEPEEQLREIQEKAILKLKKNEAEAWYNYILREEKRLLILSLLPLTENSSKFEFMKYIKKLGNHQIYL